jgi:transposase-like protein
MKKIKKYRVIDKQLKLQMMELLKTPGQNITALSRDYGISKTTLHQWKSSLNMNIISSSERFAELVVNDSRRNISKATIVFENLTVSFEGQIIGSDLISIIKTLEASC